MADSISRKGVKFISRFEGFSPTAYKLPGEQWYTIGYGHSGPSVKAGDRISKHEARKLLMHDLNRVFVPAVKSGVKRDPLRQRDLDALVSFAYNVGTGAFLSSTLLKRWNNGDDRCKVAREELPKWVRGSTGQPLPGLVKRRGAEARLICSGDYH